MAGCTVGNRWKRDVGLSVSEAVRRTGEKVVGKKVYFQKVKTFIGPILPLVPM